MNFLKYTASLHNYLLVLLGVTLSSKFLFINPLSYVIITVTITIYYKNKKRFKRE